MKQISDNGNFMFVCKFNFKELSVLFPYETQFDTYLA